MLVPTALVVLAQFAASPQEDSAPWAWEGRVVDAFTGAPVPGAECALWAENMWGPDVLVAEGTTTDRGTYALPDPEKRGQKLVVRRPGYRATEIGTPEDRVCLFPRKEPLVFRVLDLEGRPVPHAVLRTRQSCRHAVSAVRVTGDAHGVATIPDPPPMADSGDLEVLAPGFGALGKLPTRTAWSTPVLHLPRRRPARVRLLDQSGAPCVPGTVRYEGDSGGHALAPDPEGRVSIDTLFDDRDGVVFLHREEGGDLVHELAALPVGEDCTLRFGDPLEHRDDARLEVVVEGPEELVPEAEVRALHDEGWLVYGHSGDLTLPAGNWRVMLGAPFSGVQYQAARVELAAGGAERVVLTARPEPRLRVLVDEEVWTVHVQVGDDSVSLGPMGKGEVVTHVPPGSAVTVLSQGGGTRRARLEPWSGERVLDLRGPETLIEPAGAPREVELRFLVRTVVGEVPEAGTFLWADHDEREDLDPSPDGVLFRLPAGLRWEVRFAVEGYPTVFRSGLAGTVTDVEVVTLRR